jgi:fructokinase
MLHGLYLYVVGQSLKDYIDLLPPRSKPAAACATLVVFMARGLGEQMRIGVDLGGTKIEIIALDARGEEVLRRRVPTPQGDYAATLQAIAALVQEAEAELQQKCSLGVGIPGAESLATGLIKNANSTCLIGRPLRTDLERLLGREVRLANDANCFALSEASDGAGRAAGIVFGVILGTGVGGGIVVNGQLLQGANAIAGEWGHCYLPPASGSPVRPGELLPAQGNSALSRQEGWREGPACYCGRRGCVETYLSGPGLAADHLRCTGQTLGAEAIALAAAAGDSQCEATLQRYEARLAFALAQVINVLDPDVIVLGGGLSNVERFYAKVTAAWGAHVFSDEVRTRLLRNVHGDSSGVRGAAWLWPTVS